MSPTSRHGGCGPVFAAVFEVRLLIVRRESEWKRKLAIRSWSHVFDASRRNEEFTPSARAYSRAYGCAPLLRPRAARHLCVAAPARTSLVGASGPVRRCGVRHGPGTAAERQPDSSPERAPPRPLLAVSHLSGRPDSRGGAARRCRNVKPVHPKIPTIRGIGPHSRPGSASVCSSSSACLCTDHLSRGRWRPPPWCGCSPRPRRRPPTPAPMPRAERTARTPRWRSPDRVRARPRRSPPIRLTHPTLLTHLTRPSRPSRPSLRSHQCHRSHRSRPSDPPRSRRPSPSRRPRRRYGHPSPYRCRRPRPYRRRPRPPPPRHRGRPRHRPPPRPSPRHPESRPPPRPRRPPARRSRAPRRHRRSRSRTTSGPPGRSRRAPRHPSPGCS